MRARIGLAGLASMLLVAAAPPSPAVREIEARANDQAYDPEARRRLRELSGKLTGL